MTANANTNQVLGIWLGKLLWYFHKSMSLSLGGCVLSSMGVCVCTFSGLCIQKFLTKMGHVVTFEHAFIMLELLKTHLNCKNMRTESVKGL